VERGVGWSRSNDLTLSRSPTTAALRLGIERSADEEASGRPGARGATRRALLKATDTPIREGADYYVM
jgi:hypothetical protein